MAIKRDSCRASERITMLQMHEQGFSIGQISNQVSVKEHIVESVISGKWAKEEARLKKVQAKRDEEYRQKAARQKQEDATLMATAIASALADSKNESKEAPSEEASTAA